MSKKTLQLHNDSQTPEDISKKRKLSDTSILDKNEISELEDALTDYLHEIDKTDILNTHINAILAPAAYADSSIVSASYHIKECMERRVWDLESASCKILEDIVENNLTTARKSVALRALVGDPEKTLEKVALSILCTGGAINDTQKILVNEKISNIQDLPERILKEPPIKAAELPTYLEIIEANIDTTKHSNNFEDMLIPQLAKFDNTISELNSELQQVRLRLGRISNEIIQIGKSKMAGLALNMDLGIYKLEKQKDTMSHSELHNFDELAKLWENKKIELTNSNKLTSVPISDLEIEEPEHTQQLKELKSNLKTTLRNRKARRVAMDEIKDFLKYKEFLDQESSAILKSAKDVGLELTNLVAKDTLAKISEDIKHRNEKTKVLKVDETKNIATKTKTTEKSLTNE